MERFSASVTGTGTDSKDRVVSALDDGVIDPDVLLESLQPFRVAKAPNAAKIHNSDKNLM
jgi:hypothetical protein